MKANKSVNDLSTVDGSGARTNKYMMIMMPIIYGVFAFLYSAAFSLYMITNTVYSIISTLIINKAMDVWFSKRTQNAEVEQLTRRGRKN
jgi:membrane protein insertase Oxa1/YidC/SpoIIIJ